MLGRSLGLDLGSHSVKAVELQQALRRVEVSRLRAASVVPGGTETDALRDLLAGEALATDRIVCAVASDRAARRQLHLPFRDRRRIAQAVPFEVESETPFDLDEVYVDWELVSSDRREADVVATIVPRAAVASRVQALRDAGVEPRVLEAEGLVLANLAELVPLPGTRLLVDLGHRKTTLCLLVDGRARAARTLPVGAGLVTQAIARARGLDPGAAEQRKHEEGVFGRRFESTVPGAVSALDRLVRDLLRTLGGLESVLGGPAKTTLDELTLLGGGARLHRIDEYLSERIGIRSARLEVPPGEACGALLAGGDPLRFAPALALALRGGLRPRTRMNFLQGEFAPHFDLRSAGRQLRWTAILAGCAAVLAVGLTTTKIVLESSRADRLEAQLAEVWNEVAPGKPVPENVPRALQETLREARERADFLGLYKGNRSALDLLAEISALVPADLAIVFEEFAVDGQVVRIRGHTPSFAAVDQLKQALSAVPDFTDIRVSDVKADPALGGNSFSVTVSLGDREDTP
jgi:general secretion pathway protein L